jgi:hypothetical protein
MFRLIVFPRPGRMKKLDGAAPEAYIGDRVLCFRLCHSAI